MRKLLILIVAFLYLASASGATVHLHYCMGQLVEAGLWHGKQKTCKKCGMEKKAQKAKGCCKDEQKWVKLDEDQKLNKLQLQWLHVVANAAATPVPFFVMAAPAAALQALPQSHAPPNASLQRLHLRHCVFLI